MQVTDRNSITYRISSPLIKDAKNIGLLIPKVVNVLGIRQMLEDKGISYDSHSYALDEQYSALLEVLNIVTKGSDVESFDISMANKVILHALDIDKPTMPPLRILAKLDRLGVLDKIINENKGGNIMEKEITTGTTIIDREGNRYIAYSYLVVEFHEAMDLLQKIDTFNMLENHDNEESYEAMLEIVYRALNKQYTKEELLEFIDAEFIQKSIRVYYNLPQMAQ